MSKIIWVLLLVCIFNYKSFGQDILFLTNKTDSIMVKIIEVNELDVKYKKFNYLDGPTFTVNKKNISSIVYSNNEKEVFNNSELKQQKSQNLLPESKVFVKAVTIEKKNNVDEKDILEVTIPELNKFTLCSVVSNEKEADFILEVKAYKYMITKRKVKLSLVHVQSNKQVFESSWMTGNPSEFNGFSGTRQAVGRLIKKELVIKYPEIIVKKK